MQKQLWKCINGFSIKHDSKLAFRSLEKQYFSFVISEFFNFRNPWEARKGQQKGKAE
jgi:hypothetical protein